MKRILLIEDDDTIVYGISELLKEEGYDAAAVSTLREAFCMDIRAFCLVLLDLGLPDGEGWDFLRKMEKDKGAPVIILTAREDEKDIIKGLDMGADDYVTKPFKAGILLSRIRAVLRRRREVEESGAVLRCGDIVLDKNRTLVMDGDREIALTAGEFRLFMYLMENKNSTLTRNALLRYLWDSSGDYVNDNTLTVTVKRLREKLGEKSGRIIRTVRGIGYKLEDEND
ncbi:DNA-binding response regulator [Lachnospiraceae bacterium]|jgi:DNA-binding response OmpR family regulator|nr:DNA-binding response regulator [Lachnospiraceae bacterium]